MVKHWITALALFVSAPVWAQDSTLLTLEQAYDLSRENYPLIKQKNLVKQTADLTIDNLNKNYLPQVTVSGQASYQSQVTSIPLRVPGFEIPTMSKDQYRVQAEATQLLYDGGTVGAQKNLQQVNALVEDQRAEVDLYKVKERINQFYLGILLLDEQLKQTELVKKDIQLGIKRVTAQVNNGTAFRSNQLVLEAELLKAEQRTIELRATRKGWLEVLSLFLNKPLPETTALQMPVTRTYIMAPGINRPELKLFTYQDSLFKTQNQVITARNRPKTSLFVQGGYARPALDMLKNDFSWYYIAGLRLNWSLGNLYTTKKERQLLNVNQRMVDVQKDLFLLNTNTQLKQQQSELNKLQQLMESDEQIIDIRSKVKEAANAQLENGVITANDYLREVNAEDQSRLSLIAHRLQWLQAKINYETISGNQ
ncbi:TolC family protein [Paraflavitalea sp. CAU 1676]|uniref:TolC family protein n=1 Tax=Paraflavitalea sp. CAU 1676 TaxID=3032598 RepID=UPI0023DB2DA7|nr:TolC family protein [Paraflavitalea sp. CAU 1676]MDF2190086.1 TolC family protein [Paraflavitalea sp. CAU 1676]